MLNNQARKPMTYQSLYFHLWTGEKNGYIQEEDLSKSQLQYLKTGMFSWKEKKENETKNRTRDKVEVVCKKSHWGITNLYIKMLSISLKAQLFEAFQS